MALNQFSRTQLLLGQESMDLLADATVAVFGIGGVGGYTVEALARSGVGHFVLVDDDKVCLTNINRQIIATRSSVGKYKVDVMKERILDINPKAEVEVYKCFYLPENADDFDFSKYSYVVDAVDTVTAKIEIIMRAKACNVPVISCMGAGNKLDPTKFRVADIYKTNMCPLAKVMRNELKKRGVWVYGLDMDGETWCKTDLAGAVCVVVGSEGRGISRLLREQCDQILSLPMNGSINSLNASVACGIVLYEIARQRAGIAAKN